MAKKFRQYLSVSGGALFLGVMLMVGAIAVVFGGEHALSRKEQKTQRIQEKKTDVAEIRLATTVMGGFLAEE